MEQQALIDSFSDFKDEKNIDRVTLMAILEDAIRNVMKKRYGTDENIDVIVNPDKGDLEIWRNRIVVQDGEVLNPNEEVPLSEARKIEPDFEVGEEVSEEIKLEEMGRRSILTLRQNLVARIQEHDNTTTYKKFKDRIGEIVSGEVNHIRHRHVILIDDDQNEMVLPKDQQIPSDFFYKSDTVRAVIKNVEIKGSKPIILLSRSSPEFLEKLFEQEIPEVFDGLITIKDVVRSPGEKAKVAVESYDDRIDPVGACVGMKGSRIHGIVRELNNENIDVINYTGNTRLYIQRALSPAKITSIDLDEENRTADICLDPSEVSRAIGRNGHNIRLASRLTGYELNVYRDQEEEEDVALDEFSDEIDQWIIEAFKAIGCDTAKSVLGLELEDLVKRTDLEEETVREVRNILASEFE